MSYASNLGGRENMYIIPRGIKDISEVITISPGGGATRLEVFFPQNKYQVITDDTLRERNCTLGEYIKNTESWRTH